MSQVNKPRVKKSKPELTEDNEKENNKAVSSRRLIEVNFSNTEQ